MFFHATKDSLKNNTMQGTVNWMAPEVVRDNNVTRFVDIWSLASTVYEMTVGAPPWFAERDVIRKLMEIEGPPDYPDYISADLEDFFNQCFQIEPSNRANVYELL